MRLKLIGTTRVLVVDDNRSIHDDIKKVLNLDSGSRVESDLELMEEQLFGSKLGRSQLEPTPRFSIDSAYQGQEALAMAEQAARRGQPYDLIFVDIRMPPGWDGVETIKKIWDKLPDTEMVICTAYSDYSASEINARLGSTDRLLLLKKPFDSVELYQMALSISLKKQEKKRVSEEINRIEKQLLDRTQEVHNLLKKVSTSDSRFEKSFQELQDMQDKLQAVGKMAELGEMTAGIAHEINGPLGTVNMLSSHLREVLDEEPLDKPALKEIAATIEMITLRITKIVRSLQAIFRGEPAEPFVEINMRNLVEETLAFSKERFRLHNIKVETYVPPDLAVQARPVQLSQVLLNLLNNSFDAVKDLPEKWIRLTVADAGAVAEISVMDSGKGVPAEVRRHIFEPFFTTKPPGVGTGVGLHLSKTLIASHKGHLRLDEQSPNTRFILSIPKRQSRSAELPTLAT